MSGYRDAENPLRLGTDLLLPRLEIDRARYGVSMTNGAKASSARSATSAVVSNVEGRSLGNPKMNEPSTYIPCSRNLRSR